MLILVTSENPEEKSESLKHNRLPPDVSHFMDTLGGITQNAVSEVLILLL